MALAETTLSVACALGDVNVVLTSASSVAVDRILVIDGEEMKVQKGYDGSSTTVPVARGLNGTPQTAHVVSARVVHGNPSDFGDAGAGATSVYGPMGRPRKVTSLTAATSTLTLPQPGEDLLVVLNGTSVIALTVPVPTKDLDGCVLYIASNGAAAHTVTFTGGLSGASTSYDVITVNSSAPVVLGPFFAINELWQAAVAVPMAGTVTNITATVA